MLPKISIITIISFCFMFAGASHAAWTPPSWSYGQTIYRPAQEASQVGWAQDPRWQMLGDSWGVVDGVSWAMLDASNNPVGSYGHGVVNNGATVRFKFDMHKTLYGIHSFDGLRAWIDWDHNGFSSADMASDMIIQDQLVFNPYHVYSDNPWAWGWDGHKNGSLYYADIDHSFYADVTFTETGFYDLLARVTCSGDLAGDWDRLTPWANGLYQGEFEKYTVQVVPVPPAFLLLLSGVLSMGVFRRKLRPGAKAVM